MIRINLLKKQDRTKAPRAEKAPAKVPAWVVPVVLGVVLLGAGSAGYLFFIRKDTVPPPVPQASVTPQVMKPSTHVRPNMVEDVVKEVGEGGRKSLKDGFLDVAYQDMSFGEKISYEVLFAKNVVEMMGRAGLRHEGGAVTAYGHLEEALVATGAKVEQGAIIGRAGASGNAREPQLMFQLRLGRRAVDPLPYLRGQA